MHYIETKSILSPKNGMNLYRGCQHGCIYCDSRSLCYRMNHRFEDVAVKKNGIELLEQNWNRDWRDFSEVCFDACNDLDRAALRPVAVTLEALKDAA